MLGLETTGAQDTVRGYVRRGAGGMLLAETVARVGEYGRGRSAGRTEARGASSQTRRRGVVSAQHHKILKHYERHIPSRPTCGFRRSGDNQDDRCTVTWWRTHSLSSPGPLLRRTTVHDDERSGRCRNGHSLKWSHCFRYECEYEYEWRARGESSCPLGSIWRRRTLNGPLDSACHSRKLYWWGCASRLFFSFRDHEKFIYRTCSSDVIRQNRKIHNFDGYSLLCDKSQQRDRAPRWRWIVDGFFQVRAELPRMPCDNSASN